MRRKNAAEKCGTFSGDPEYIDNRTENGARLDFRFALFALLVVGESGGAVEPFCKRLYR